MDLAALTREIHSQRRYFRCMSQQFTLFFILVMVSQVLTTTKCLRGEMAEY